MNQKEIALYAHAQTGEIRAVSEVQIVKVKPIERDRIELNLVEYFAMRRNENTIQRLRPDTLL